MTLKRLGHLACDAYGTRQPPITVPYLLRDKLVCQHADRAWLSLLISSVTVTFNYPECWKCPIRQGKPIAGLQVRWHGGDAVLTLYGVCILLGKASHREKDGGGANGLNSSSPTVTPVPGEAGKECARCLAAPGVQSAVHQCGAPIGRPGCKTRECACNWPKP